MQEWFESGLQQWISPATRLYFGFEIPNAPGKYFYVWLDAPIGYMGSFKNLCDKRGDSVSFDEYWKKDSLPSCITSSVKISFTSTACSGLPCWKAATSASRPTCLFTAMTVNGAKMSKSRGTFIKASTRIILTPTACATTTPPNCLRALMISISTWKILLQRVNADIVNKVVNSRPVTLALSISVLTVCWQASWLTRSCTKPSLMPLKVIGEAGKPRIW